MIRTQIKFKKTPNTKENESFCIFRVMTNNWYFGSQDYLSFNVKAGKKSLSSKSKINKKSMPEVKWEQWTNDNGDQIRIVHPHYRNAFTTKYFSHVTGKLSIKTMTKYNFAAAAFLKMFPAIQAGTNNLRIY